MLYNIRFDQLFRQRYTDFQSLCALEPELMNEWNSLSNHITELNSIAAFNRNVLHFNEDN